MEHVYTYDAHVQGGDQFIINVSMPLACGDLIECKGRAFRVLYVLHAGSRAYLPSVLLRRADPSELPR